MLAGLARGAARAVRQGLYRGEADHQSWMACLHLHCRTNGRSTELLRRVMKILRPSPAPLRPFESMLGRFDVQGVRTIAEQIRTDGYYVFKERIPDSVCNQIAAAARSTEGLPGRNPEKPQPMAIFDPANPDASVYDIPEARIWQIPGYQRIIADPIFVNLSQAYFGAASVLKQVNLWWSGAVGGQADTNAAQLFHFDFDPAPIWLKFFIYLSDVTPATGPHVFVKGSHRLRQPRASEILSRGYVRISDEDIAEAYGRENIVELSGPKGTVFAVDTIGFHKGKPPETGFRLLAQLEYATPLFVASVSDPLPLPANAEPQLLATRKAYPWAFARFPISV